MQVGIINFSNLKYAQNVSSQSSTSNKMGEAENKPSQYMQAPVGCFNQYAVSFGRQKLYALSLNDLKIKDLPCPCCGKKMIPAKELLEVFNKNSELTSCKDIIKVVQPYEEHLHKIEKQVFGMIKEKSKDMPDASLEDVVADFFDESLPKLKKSQLSIINNIDELSKDLPEKQATQIKQTVNNAQNAIENYYGNTFKKKSFVKNINNAFLNKTMNDTHRKILELAESLPSSSDDIDAFIVKYSRRTSNEIFERLLKPSRSTIEHIHAHCLFNDGKEADKMTNLILECGSCNEEKSDSTLQEQLAKHPEMKENLQKHFDTLIAKINNGEISSEYKPEYLVGLAKTIEDESGQIVKLNTSELKNPAGV